MRPEKGDPNIQVTWLDVCRAVQEVGVRSGDTVMFHSSLSSMGTVVGGPDAVIRGFLEAVGAEGTVAVPTLCNWEPGEESLVFQRWDPKSSPAYVGAIPDRFWRWPEARRSDHATHSVAAIGARAEELTANHGTSGLRPGPFGDRAFARESPWQKLADWNAAYCFIGVTMRVATAVHLVETLVVERALARCPEDARARLSAEVVGWMKPGVWPSVRMEDREVLEEQLAGRGLVRYGRIGSATLRCTRVGDLVHTWVSALESDPGRWLPEEFCRWLAGAMTRDPWGGTGSA